MILRVRSGSKLEGDHDTNTYYILQDCLSSQSCGCVTAEVQMVIVYQVQNGFFPCLLTMTACESTSVYIGKYFQMHSNDCHQGQVSFLCRISPRAEYSWKSPSVLTTCHTKGIPIPEDKITSADKYAIGGVFILLRVWIFFMYSICMYIFIYCVCILIDCMHERLVETLSAREMCMCVC